MHDFHARGSPELFVLSVRSLMTHPGQLRLLGRVPAALHPVCGLPTPPGRVVTPAITIAAP